MDGDEAGAVFGQLATDVLKDLLHMALIRLAHRGLATLADLELLDDLESQSQHQPLAA